MGSNHLLLLGLCKPGELPHAQLLCLLICHRWHLSCLQTKGAAALVFHLFLLFPSLCRERAQRDVAWRFCAGLWSNSGCLSVNCLMFVDS